MDSWEMDSCGDSLPASSKRLLPIISTIGCFVLAGFRFACAACVALILSIAASGSWVNWPNVKPLFGCIAIALITTHLVEWFLSERSKSVIWNVGPYLLGSLVAVAFFQLDRSVDWFGRFTGV